MSAIAVGIPRGNNIREVLYKNGDTQDIISAILLADKKATDYTKDFAQTLKGATVKETCSNIWHWVKKHIKYKLDPNLEQWIKSPAQTVSDGYADCKSYSILVGSLFRNIYPHIPVYYRFASYGTTPTATHVYVVVKEHLKKPIIIDDVLPRFNFEKKPTFKKDYRMTQISYIHGIGAVNPEDEKYRVPLGSNEDWAKGTLTDADLDLAIYRDKIITEQKAVSGMGAFGFAKARKYAALLKKVDATRSALHKFKKNRRISGIGSAEAQLNADFADIANSITGIGKTKVGKFLSKVGKGVKKVAKAVVKIATAPMRLAAKGALEVALPKSAPFFKYLFITNPTTIANLPDKVKRKRAKSESIANFIVDAVGMKRPHLMGILRNGFVKRTGKSPEAVLAAELKGQAINGIGFIGDIAKLALELLGLIKKLFGKKGPDVSEDDAPSPDDFNNMSPEEKDKLAKSIKNNAGPEYVDPNYDDKANGGGPTGKKTGIC